MGEFFSVEKKATTAQWLDHKVRQFNGPYEQISIDAKKMIPSKNIGHDDFLSPKLLYLPEKGRLLIGTNYNNWTGMDYVMDNVEDIALIMISDDMGETWRYSEPVVDRAGVPILSGHFVDMVDLGGGRILMISAIYYQNEAIECSNKKIYRFISEDWGETWTYDGEIDTEFAGQPVGHWTSLYVDPLYSKKDEKLLSWTGYNSFGGFLQFSRDYGRTWSKPHQPAAFKNVNEINFVRAKNGDLVAVMRFFPEGSDYAAWGIDHVCGIKTCYSADNGWTWSEPKLLFEFGRHQTDFASMPNGDIVLSYIVRQGYPRDEYGHIQCGMEAVVSHDYGRTWDLDHRYILDDWAGQSPYPMPLELHNSGQSTSTVLLEDNSLMTICTSGVNARPGTLLSCAFHRTQGFELHLVHWRLNEGPVNDCTMFADADPHSDLRNKVCNHATKDANLAAWMQHHRNIALPELGVTVTGSESDRAPDRILEDRYSRRTVFFVTCPAWFEINFPEEKCIDGLVIHVGAAPDPYRLGMDYIPADYTIRYQNADGAWVDVIPPVVGKKPVPYGEPFFVGTEELTHEYSFEPVVTQKLRFDITKTSDSGRTKHLWRDIVLPEEKRRTAIRKVEVLEKR